MEEKFAWRPIVGWTLAVLTVGVFLYATATGDGQWRLLTKPWPVLLLALRLHWALKESGAPQEIYTRRIRNGLLASAVGDICLEFEAGFLPGMLAFLIGHLFYVAAYLNADRAARWARAVPFVLWGAGVIYLLQEGLSAAGMLIPVSLYTAVICTMMWRAVARIRPGAGLDVGWAVAGALLFAVSDTLIAVTRFGPDIVGAPYWIIILYWLGQWGIAQSAVVPRARSNSTE